MDLGIALGSSLGPGDIMTLIGSADHLALHGPLRGKSLDTNMGTDGNSDPRHLRGLW